MSVDFALEPLIEQHWEPATVINMGMAEDNGIQLSRVERKTVVVTQLVFSSALNEATIEQNLGVAYFN